MFKKLLERIKNNPGAAFITLVVAFLIVANYTRGTYLTGWDTLHPEFNYKTYWSRMLLSSWQEHQGLGAVATQAHASEIPRVMTLMLFDIFLPTSMVRYAYAFLMLLLGPLGVYFFTKKAIFRNEDSKLALVESASAAAGLFYLLNLVTLQHFYVPLEMFLTHYGYLGFLMLAISNLLAAPSKKNIWVLILVSILMAPQAHTSTLFFALLVNLFAYLALYWLLSENKLEIFKRGLLAFVLLFVTNAFWLLPNFYFIVKHGSTVQFSKIHSLFNEEAVLQNRAYGTIDNIAIGKGFLFNWGEYIGDLSFGELLNEWKYYQRDPAVTNVGYALFFFSLLGLVLSVIQKRKEAIAVIGLFLISMFFLINVNEPTGFIYSFFEEHIPLFKEAFRFHFTKFSITLVFSYAVLFAYFLYGIQSLLQKIIYNSRGVRTIAVDLAIGILALVVVFSTLFYWMRPAFRGGLISPSMRVKIPSAYFDMFDYLNEQDDFGRVANLPIHSFWGWVYYNWDPVTDLGYQGAGFLWFGIKQPLLDREFDRWNVINQEYYNDMVAAVYSEDSEALINVLNKYKIRWLLHDTSIIAPGYSQTILFKEELLELLSNTEGVSLTKKFGKDLYLYTYSPDEPFELLEQLAVEETDASYSDYLFREVTDYSERINKSYIGLDNASHIGLGVRGQKGQLNSTFGVKSLFELSATYDSKDLYLNLKSKLDGNTTPTVLKVPLETRKSAMIAIAEDVFEVDLSKNIQEAVLGDVYLPLDSTFSLELHVANASEESYDLRGLIYELETCSKAGDKSSYSIEAVENGFALAAERIDVCLTASMDSFIDKEAFQGKYLKLSVAGDFEDPPCIYSASQGHCTNYVSDKNTSYARVSRVIDDQFIRFFSRGLSKGWKNSSFKDMSLKVFDQPIATTEVKLNSKTVENLQNLELEMPLFFDVSSLHGGAVKDISSNPRHCLTDDPVEAYDAGRSVMVYSTDDEQICDSFRFYNTPHNLGYILRVRARNIEGIPLRVCLTNEITRRCDKFIEIPKSDQFQDAYYFVPSFDDGSGYTVDISNISFAGHRTSNELSHVQLIPVPYELLMNLKHVSASSTGSTYVYNQAYEDGWLALCGLSVCKAEHFIYNGWANGWSFDEPYAGKVTIVYWPQLLQHIGFILLAAAAVLVYNQGSRVDEEKH